MRCGRSLFCRSDYWSEVRRFTLLKNEAVTASRLVRGCQLTGLRVGRNRRPLIVSAANGKYPSRFSGLSDVHARNGPCNDQALYFRSPFENRVGIGVAHNPPGQKLFPESIDPRMRERDPFTGNSDRFCNHLVGPVRAPQFSTVMLPVMRSTANNNPARPLRRRLRTKDDPALNFGFNSVSKVEPHPPRQEVTTCTTVLLFEHVCRTK